MFRLVVVIASLFVSQNIACAGELSPKLVQTISLPGVSGRLDHMAIDLEKGRLFLAALGNGSLEVIDLKEGSRTRRIVHLKEPQGVCFIPGLNRLFVTTANGEFPRLPRRFAFPYRGSIPPKMPITSDTIRDRIAFWSALELDRYHRSRGHPSVREHPPGRPSGIFSNRKIREDLCKCSIRRASGGRGSEVAPNPFEMGYSSFPFLLSDGLD